MFCFGFKKRQSIEDPRFLNSNVLIRTKSVGTDSFFPNNCFNPLDRDKARKLEDPVLLIDQKDSIFNLMVISVI